MPKILNGYGDNARRVVVSLCDYSGNWPKPYHEAGHTVLCYDLKHGDDVTKLTAVDVWNHIRAALDAQFPTRLWSASIACILCAAPCTDFAVSGARHWRRKDADGTTRCTLAVLDSCMSLIEALEPAVWALENPVGRIPTLRPNIGRPNFYFHPSDYAAYLPGPEQHTEAYTKRTGIWGRCKRPLPAPVEPIMHTTADGKRGSWMWAKLGGKSERTKTLRSMTPMGFARAFATANPLA